EHDRLAVKRQNCVSGHVNTGLKKVFCISQRLSCIIVYRLVAHPGATSFLAAMPRVYRKQLLPGMWAQKIVFHLKDRIYAKSYLEEFCEALWIHSFATT